MATCTKEWVYRVKLPLFAPFGLGAYLERKLCLLAAISSFVQLSQVESLLKRGWVLVFASRVPYTVKPTVTPVRPAWTFMSFKGNAW